MECISVSFLFKERNMGKESFSIFQVKFMKAILAMTWKMGSEMNIFLMVQAIKAILNKE